MTVGTGMMKACVSAFLWLWKANYLQDDWGGSFGLLRVLASFIEQWLFLGDLEYQEQ